MREVELVETWDGDLRSTDPLSFPGYRVPDAGAESVRTGLAALNGQELVVVDCAFARQGGTMGVVAGERIVRAFEQATARRLPVVSFVSSGGARLQEGMFALVQMPRTVAALARHRAAGLLSAAVLRSPTTGGVFASWVSLADLRAAAPHAVVGFGGPRVVETMTGRSPTADSHTAESAFASGLVDALVAPADELAWVAAVLGTGPAQPLRATHGEALPPPRDRGDAYDAVLRARDPHRASGVDWAARLTDGWVDLRGPDPVIRAGIGVVAGRRVVVVATDRHAFVDGAGRPGPAGYRLARRAISLADRLGLPVLTLVDTPGADPSPASEAAGIAGEIAATLLAMTELRSPSVCVCVGEGGSGGAVALAHADTLLMLPDAVFSVLGPEAAASVLYRDAGRAAQVASVLRLTADELMADRIVDGVLPPDVAAARQAIARELAHARPGTRTSRPARATARALSSVD